MSNDNQGIYFNGVLYSSIEELMQDPDFAALPQSAKCSVVKNCGGESQELDLYTQVPMSVTPRQIRTALVLSGISLSSIENIIQSLPSPDKDIALIAWEYSVEFQRNNPLINQLAPLLGLSNKQIDDIFILASTL